MEHFVLIVNGFEPLTTITKRSILDVAAVLDPSLNLLHYTYQSMIGLKCDTLHMSPGQIYTDFLCLFVFFFGSR